MSVIYLRNKSMLARLMLEELEKKNDNFCGVGCIKNKMVFKCCFTGCSHGIIIGRNIKQRRYIIFLLYSWHIHYLNPTFIDKWCKIVEELILTNRTREHGRYDVGIALYHLSRLERGGCPTSHLSDITIVRYLSD